MLKATMSLPQPPLSIHRRPPPPIPPRPNATILAGTRKRTPPLTHRTLETSGENVHIGDDIPPREVRPLVSTVHDGAMTFRQELKERQLPRNGWETQVLSTNTSQSSHPNETPLCSANTRFTPFDNRLSVPPPGQTSLKPSTPVNKVTPWRHVPPTPKSPVLRPKPSPLLQRKSMSPLVQRKPITSPTDTPAVKVKSALSKSDFSPPMYRKPSPPIPNKPPVRDNLPRKITSPFQKLPCDINRSSIERSGNGSCDINKTSLERSGNGSCDINRTSFESRPNIVERSENGSLERNANEREDSSLERIARVSACSITEPSSVAIVEKTSPNSVAKVSTKLPTKLADSDNPIPPSPSCLRKSSKTTSLERSPKLPIKLADSDNPIPSSPSCLRKSSRTPSLERSPKLSIKLAKSETPVPPSPSCLRRSSRTSSLERPEPIERRIPGQASMTLPSRSLQNKLHSALNSNGISKSTPPGLQGLPPLPKSLSGVNLLLDTSPPPPPAPTRPMRHPPPPPPDQGSGGAGRKPVTVPTTLDTKLALLRKEMYGLRQLDLTLLSQLWTLNESIQEFRAIQEALSPQSDLDESEDAYLYGNMTASFHHRSSSSSNSSTVDFINM